MKNQYFGDINDYRKYGLLRILSDNGRIKTMVCWMLTDNDTRTDGKHISFLQKAETWRRFDPELFDFLQRCLKKDSRRVRNIEKSTIIPSSLFYSTIVTDSIAQREKYFSGLSSLASDCDLIFFDPDNGIEVKSRKYGAKLSCKYVYWNELQASYRAGHSLLVYQHFPRVEHKNYIAMIAKNIQLNLNVNTVIALATSSVVYFLIPQTHSIEYYRKRMKLLQKVWEDNFLIVEKNAS